jgi:hypothetical protein
MPDKSKEISMPDETPSIGLSDLIQKIRHELLSSVSDSEEDVPILSIDSVELELQVTVKKQGTSGIKIYVVNIGGGITRDDVQKIKVKLSPLLNKDQLLAVYKQKNPEKWKKFLATSSESLMKGSEDPGI